LTSLDATPSEDEVPMSEYVQDSDPNPEQIFAHTELKEMIQANVGQLSSQLFTAFVLCGHTTRHTSEGPFCEANLVSCDPVSNHVREWPW
jgi:hypothetical protein